MGNAETRRNLINSIYLAPAELEEINQYLQEKYRRMEQDEIRYENYKLDDAEIVGIAFGTTSRVMYSAVDKLREKGIKAGMLRPITLFPFPKPQIDELTRTERVRAFLVVEMSNGQMVDDVRLVVEGRKPVHFYNRMGGIVPKVDELIEQFEKIAE